MNKLVFLLSVGFLGFKIQGFELDHGSSRVVNGKTSTPGQFPYQVLLIGRIPNGWLSCGGSLLSNQWVLTAAHCTGNVGVFEIHLGAQSLDNYSEPGRIILKSNKIIVHEGYYAPYLTNDLALVRLPKKVKLSSRIQPVSLPTDQDLLVNKTVVISGWGLKSTGDTHGALELQYAELQVISNAQCLQTYNRNFVKYGTLCAVGLEYQSTCSGDSGGPLVLNGTRTLVGVTSYGSTESCNLGWPNGFSRVSVYLKWIESKTGLVSGS